MILLFSILSNRLRINVLGIGPLGVSHLCDTETRLDLGHCPLWDTRVHDDSPSVTTYMCLLVKKVLSHSWRDPVIP